VQAHKKTLTLCFVTKDNTILLGLKKRGFGQGLWNGFGGKVEESDISLGAAAKRELYEESGLTAPLLTHAGILHFTFIHNLNELLEVHVFRAHSVQGTLKETIEMKPQWFEISQTPYDRMWADDRYWLPIFLQGHQFRGHFVFENHSTLRHHRLKILSPVNAKA
jgi:8-oxo-dGTP diphosphatase/2-hydroxy-dATP diphosphatase